MEATKHSDKDIQTGLRLLEGARQNAKKYYAENRDAILERRREKADNDRRAFYLSHGWPAPPPRDVHRKKKETSELLKDAGIAMESKGEELSIALESNR